MSRIKKLLPIAVCILIAGCYAPTDHTHDKVCVVDTGGNSGEYWCYEDITEGECLSKGDWDDNSFWTDTSCEEFCASLESQYLSYVWNPDPEDNWFGKCEVE
jgi:hypothetical protein